MGGSDLEVSGWEVRNGRHPLCDCPEERPPGFPFRIIMKAPQKCRGGRVAHPELVLTAADIAAIVEQYRDRSESVRGDPRP